MLPNNKTMKKYKVRDVLKLLKQDGWILKRMRGDHRQFGHPEKRTTVTVNGKPSDDLTQGLLNSIWKQAGWK